MKTTRYIIKTLILLLVSGVTVISPLKALDTTSTTGIKPVVLSDKAVGYAIKQNIENLDIDIEDIFSRTLLNLIDLSVYYADDNQKSEILTILKTRSMDAETPSMRFKAYLTQVTLRDRELIDWVKENKHDTAEEFFTNLLSMLNSSLIGTPVSESHIKN